MSDSNASVQVWVFLVERGLANGSDLELFFNEADALDAARKYLSSSRLGAQSNSPNHVYELVESANQEPGAEEHLLVAPFPVTGRRAVY